MVTHDENNPLSRRQPADLGLEHLAQLPRVRPFLGPGRLLRRVHHLVFGFFPERRRSRRHRPAAVVDTGVHDDSIHPGAELRVLAEFVERAIDLDEDFLGDVFSIEVVAGELIGHAIDHRSVTLDKRLKRGRVAARRTGDQIRISHSGLAAPPPASDRITPERQPAVSCI